MVSLPTVGRSPSDRCPAGLKLHAATGAISGTPTAGGNFTFVAAVTDSEAGAQTSSASETVTAGVSGLVVTTGSTLPTATGGVPYSVKLGAAGGVTPYQWRPAAFQARSQTSRTTHRCSR